MKAGYITRVAALALTLATVSCTDSVTQGTGSSFLIVQQLTAASGAEPDDFGGTLFSDVVNMNDDGTTSTFADFGQVAQGQCEVAQGADEDALDGIRPHDLEKALETFS